EHGTGGERHEKRAARLVRDVAGVAAQHEHCAVREVQDTERAVDDREPGADEREQRAERQAVGQLRQEIGPADHGAPRGRDARMTAARVANGGAAEILAPRRANAPGTKCTSPGYNRRRRASASGRRPAPPRPPPSSPPCSSCPWAPCP